MGQVTLIGIARGSKLNPEVVLNPMNHTIEAKEVAVLLARDDRHAEAAMRAVAALHRVAEESDGEAAAERNGNGAGHGQSNGNGSAHGSAQNGGKRKGNESYAFAVEQRAERGRGRWAGDGAVSNRAAAGGRGWIKRLWLGANPLLSSPSSVHAYCTFRRLHSLRSLRSASLIPD